MRYLLFVLFFLLCSFSYAQRGVVEGEILPEIPREYKDIERTWSLQELDLPWISSDINGDGLNDVAFMVYEDNFNTKQELIDSNYDGYVDEFAYYNKQGNIVYQEFDTNHDKKIDYWAEIYNGERVLRIQRDLDFDGYINRDYNFKTNQ